MINKDARFESLDSLRGLAALSVVVCHYLAILPRIYDDKVSYGILKYTPLGIIWAGPEAVILFFILSGFVLSLPFLTRPVDWRIFWVKRILRIYVPYLASIAFGLLLMALFYRGHNSQLSTWFNQIWDTHFPFSLLVNHGVLITSFSNAKISPVIWSLVHEMRISLFFPVLMVLAMKFGIRHNIRVALGLTIVSYLLHKVTKFLPDNDYFQSIHYTGFFIVGIILAQNKERVAQYLEKRGFLLKMTLFSVGIMLYTYNFWFFRKASLLHSQYLADWIVGLGAIIFVMFAMCKGKFARLMQFRPLVLLGRISYSLYLFHALILLAFVHALYGILPIWGIWSVSFCATMVISSLSYLTFERWSIRWGRKFQQRISENIA